MPVIGIQTLGFIYVAYISFVQSSGKYDKKRSLHQFQFPNENNPYTSTKNDGESYAKEEDVINTRSYSKSLVHTSVSRQRDPSMDRKQSKVIGIGLVFFVLASGIIAYVGYQNTVYPIDKAVAYLGRAETTQTPDLFVDYVNLARQNLPREGNPVWPFATAKTDFSSIQNELDALILRGRLVSYLEPNSASYNTALIDMHNSVQKISSNLADAIPFMYINMTNVILASLWILMILVVIKIVTRRKERLSEFKS
jgi:hypothetical protein